MRRLPVLLATAALAGVLAPAALADASAATVPDSVEMVGSTKRFTLAGIHWRGPGRVLFRTRSLAGRWSGWRPASPEPEDGPDRGSSELAPRKGWRIGNPWWVGPASRIETRTVGSVSGVRAHLVWSPELRVPYRTLQATVAPPIVPRLSWGADESIRRAGPTYADAVRFAVVHHTAGTNDYSQAEAAAIVRGIQLYHVKSNGWNDIGYNFLVDRFGTVYEGRFGGAEKNVVGAHAQGFNTGSVGIALLGTYGSRAPSKAAEDAIARIVAWRLDLAHADPTGVLTFVSGGSNRFASGVPVLLRAVSGHRDTGFTECPGDLLYERLNTLASAAGKLGLPKLYEPRVEQGEGIVRFRARFSSSLSWTVVVSTQAGVEVARAQGTGAALDWSWDAVAVPRGRYRWSMSAGTARPASGSLTVGGAAGALGLQVSPPPAALTPNADGQGDTATIGYRLTAAANVTVAIVDAAGVTVATPVDRVWTNAGEHAITLDGAALADGRYTITVTARSATGAQVQQTAPLVVSRTLGLVVAEPAVFSPNGDGRNDTLALAFSLSAPAEVSVRILRDGRWVASPHRASYEPGAYRFTWNGARAGGPLRDGTYSAAVEAVDAAVGAVGVSVPFAVDVSAPLVRFLPGKGIRVFVTEPGLLHLRVDGARLQHEVRRRGIVRVPWSGAGRRVRVVAEDGVGNRSAPVLRKRPPGTG